MTIVPRDDTSGFRDPGGSSAPQPSLFDAQLQSSEVERLRAKITTLEAMADERQKDLAALTYKHDLLARERTILKGYIQRLEAENSALTTLLRLGAQRFAPEPATQDLVRALTQLAARVHPDRHGGAALATELTQEVLKVRDEVAGKKGKKR